VPPRPAGPAPGGQPIGAPVVDGLVGLLARQIGPVARLVVREGLAKGPRPPFRPLLVLLAGLLRERGLLDESAQLDQEIDQLVGAWRNGDTAKLASLLSEEFDEFPDLYRTLTVDRNRAWMTRLTDLLDDRDDRPGAKFASLDLVGIPWQLIVGPKGVAEGMVELKRRATGERQTLPLEAALKAITA